MNKIRISISIISLILLGGVLSACVGGEVAQGFSWPGLTIDQEAKIGYLASSSHAYAVDLTDGRQNWQFPAEGDKLKLTLSAPPGLTNDGQVIAPSYEKTIYSLDAEKGQQLWASQIGDNRYYAAPLILDDRIYAANIDHNLYAVDLDGNLVRTFETTDALWSTPVTDGKSIYQSGMDHFVYALDPITFRLIWQTSELGGAMAGSPTPPNDGRIYVGNFGSLLTALDVATGKTVWQTSVEGWIYSEPVLKDGVLYFGTLEGIVYAVDEPTGKIIWQVKPDDANIRELSGAPLVLDESIYIGSSSGNFFQLSRENGQKLACKKIAGKLYGPTQTVNISEQGDLVLVTPLGRGPSLMALDTELKLKWFFPPDPETDLSKLVTDCE